MTWRNLLKMPSPWLGRVMVGPRKNELPDVRSEERWIEADGIPSRSLQQLWFATLRAEWRSLVVVPAHPGGTAVPIARALAAVGTVHLNEPVEVLEGGALSLEETGAFVEELRAKLETGSRAIVTIDPLVSSLAGLPVALQADAVLLAVTLGSADLRSARETIELLGADRVIGAVAVRPRRKR